MGSEMCIRDRNVIKRFSSLIKMDNELPIYIANRYSFYVSGFNESRRGTSPNYFISKPYSGWTDLYKQEILTSYESTLCEISKYGQVSVFAPFPEFEFRVSDRISRDIMLNGTFEMPTLSVGEYAKRNRFVLPMLDRVAENCNVQVLDPILELCPSGTCYGADDSGIRYTDSNHLSRYGAAFLTDFTLNVAE